MRIGSQIRARHTHLQAQIFNFWKCEVAGSTREVRSCGVTRTPLAKGRYAKLFQNSGGSLPACTTFTLSQSRFSANCSCCTASLAASMSWRGRVLDVQRKMPEAAMTMYMWSISCACVSPGGGERRDEWSVEGDWVGDGCVVASAQIAHRYPPPQPSYAHPPWTRLLTPNARK